MQISADTISEQMIRMRTRSLSQNNGRGKNKEIIMTETRISRGAVKE